MRAWNAPLSTLVVAAISLVNTNWMLQSFNEGGVETKPVNEITLQFGADGKAGGNSGCNSFGGDFKTTGTNLSFGPLISTKRACADERANQQEVQFFGALERAGRYDVTGDKMTIFYDNNKNKLNFVKKNGTATSTAPPTSSGVAGNCGTVQKK